MMDERSDLMGSVVVAREMCARKGHETEFEAAMQALMDAAGRQPGHLGVTVVKPQAEGAPYRFYYRFDAVQSLQAWHSSDLRASLMRAVEPHIDGDRFQVHDGFAVWLDVPLAPPHPVKWRMVFTTWLGIFPTVVVVSLILRAVKFEGPLVVRALVLSALTVPIAAYFVVPFLTRWLKPWIYRS